MLEIYESVLEQDTAPIVICDLDHIIIYMNSAAIRSYDKRGGAELVGKSLLACHNEQSNLMIKKVISWFAESENNNKVHTFFNEKQNKDVYMVALRDRSGKLVAYYEKHEFRNKDNSPFYEMN